MIQIDFGFLSNILGLLLATLSVLLTILIALIGYFVSKFNNLIDSVDDISTELGSLNDTNERIEEDLDGISTAIVRIEERTRQNTDGGYISSVFNKRAEEPREKLVAIDILTVLLNREATEETPMSIDTLVRMVPQFDESVVRDTIDIISDSSGPVETDNEYIWLSGLNIDQLIEDI